MAEAYLDALVPKAPELGQQLQELHDLHKRRLWHQLTEKTLSLVSDTRAQSQLDLGEFYSRFLLTFASKLNQLTFVRIAIVIATQPKDVAQRIQFLSSVSELPKVVAHKEAQVNVHSALSELNLIAGNQEQAKKSLETAKSALDETYGADATVFSAYHHAAAAYHKTTNSPSDFYTSALQYLGYTPLEEINADELRGLAFDLGIAALTAEKIYNFGDLMEHEVLEKLKNSDRAWLWEVLQAFNSGDIAAWKSLQSKYSAQMNQQGALKSAHALLARKIAILALVEMVFAQPSDKRTVTFSAVANAAEIAINEVELLVMHALSLGLIKGTIDEVAQEISITWVQPRILSLPQVDAMGKRLHEWTGNVSGALGVMQNHLTSELVA